MKKYITIDYNKITLILLPAVRFFFFYIFLFYSILEINVCMFKQEIIQTHFRGFIYIYLA